MTDRAIVASWRQRFGVILAEMDAELCEPSILDVPYLPQWGVGADVRKGDCGPACLAMLAHFRTAYRPTVDEAATACGQPATGEGASSTGHKELRIGAAAYGIALATRSKYAPPELTLELLKAQVDKGLPSICVIHYGVLRDYTNAMPGVITNLDQNYARGHWVLFTGYSPGTIYVMDSNFWGARMNDGNRRAVPERVFIEALKAVAPGCTVGYQGLVVM